MKLISFKQAKQVFKDAFKGFGDDKGYQTQRFLIV